MTVGTFTLSGPALCPEPSDLSSDGRHVADLGGSMFVAVDTKPRPLCRGCGRTLKGDPNWPGYWLLDLYVIVEESW